MIMLVQLLLLRFNIKGISQASKTGNGLEHILYPLIVLDGDIMQANNPKLAARVTSTCRIFS